MKAAPLLFLAPLALALVALVATLRSGSAQEGAKSSAPDRAAVEACLKLAADRRNTQPDKAEDAEAEQHGAAAYLDAAASSAKSDAASCIGIVNVACQAEEGGSSTHGMIRCADRERAVWDERLNQNYRSAIFSGDPKLREAYRKIERAWIAWRDAKCALPSVEQEGGSIVGPLTATCLLEATARQAIWLEGR